VISKGFSKIFKEFLKKKKNKSGLVAQPYDEPALFGQLNNNRIKHGGRKH